MDPVTHTLLGVAIGEGFFKSRLGKRAVIVSAVAANLPDIDALVHVTMDPAAVLLRRSFGHSLFLLPLWIWGLTWLFKRKYDDIETRDLAWIIAVNCVGHLCFDLINSFGVQLLWPFSSMRPELAIAFIIDLTLTGLLLAPHLARLKASWRPEVGALCRASLVAVAFYLGLCFSARQYALSLLAKETGGKGFQYAFPEALGASRWRGVVKGEHDWKVYLINAGKSTVEFKDSVPNDEWSPPARRALETPLGRRLETFFKAAAWSAQKNPDGSATVRVHDLRFTSLVLPRAAAFEYAFDVPADALAPAKARGVKIW